MLTVLKTTKENAISPYRRLCTYFEILAEWRDKVSHAPVSEGERVKITWKPEQPLPSFQFMQGSQTL